MVYATDLLRWTLFQAAGKRNRQQILVACMPKSGSTFLTSVIGNLPGYRQACLVPAYGHREQELSEIMLSRHCLKKYVAQHHVRHSDWTEHVLKKYGVTPVVLTRHLFDVVPSMVDHINKESPVAPAAHIEQSLTQFPREKQLHFAAQLVVPWYVNFYMGWRESISNGFALHITYEQMIEDTLGTVKRVLEHAGARISDDVITTAIEKTYGDGGFRFNAGRAGRGGGLPVHSKEYIREMLGFYPEARNDEFIKGIFHDDSVRDRPLGERGWRQ